QLCQADCGTRGPTPSAPGADRHVQPRGDKVQARGSELQARAPAPDRAPATMPDQGRTARSRREADGQAMAAVLLQSERLDRDHGGEGQRAREMGEQVPAARWFPAELGAKPIRVQGKKHEIAVPGEEFGESAGDLAPRRQMDEAVATVVGRAVVAPMFPCLLQGGGGADLVNRLSHGLTN